MTSDSQRTGHEPDDAASGADWAPPRTEHSGTAAPRGDRTPPEFGWAMPDESWQRPGDSWTVAYPEAASASTWSHRQSNDAEFPGGWPPLQEPAHRAPPSTEPASDRAEHTHRLPKRVPGPIELPEDGAGRPDVRYEQTVRAPRAAVPAPPPPLPPQATRIPGASLAAEPPLGYSPPDQYGPPSGRYQPEPSSGRYQPEPPSGRYQPEPPSGRYQPEPPAGPRPITPYDFGGERQPAPAERRADADRWAQVPGDEPAGFPAGQGRARVSPQPPAWEPPPPYLPGSPVETPQQYDRPSTSAYGTPSRPVTAAQVPAQRTGSAESGDSAPARPAISASATVPPASRMSPPSDSAAMSMPAAQPRVYGRWAAEPVDDHVEPVRTDRSADAAGGDEPLWPRTPADSGDRFPGDADAAGSRLLSGSDDRFQRDAGPWSQPAAEPWPRDDRPEVPSAPDWSTERPGRAAAFAQVPAAPIPAPDPNDQQREPGGRFAQPDEPAPDAFGPMGPATGTARPVSSVGGARPPRVDDRPPSDEGGSRPPAARWDDQPPRQPWGGEAGNPDQTLIGPGNGLDAGDSRANAWPGGRAEAVPTGRATAAGTARVGGIDAEARRPPQAAGPDTGTAAPSWADRDGRQQDRFDSFRTELESPADPPPPQVRNARVLAIVLVAAVLLLAVPLGTLWLLGRTGDEGFNPSVGSCVKQDGEAAVAAGCGDAGAYTVVAKASDPGKCDPKQPHIVLQNVEGDNVLCLRPAAAR